MSEPWGLVLASAAILLGFLFAGFWWSLDRELKFKADERHFKPGYALLFLSICLVGYFGVLLPLRTAAESVPSLLVTYRGVALGLVAIIGYMLTEYAHHSVFQRPKYTTKLEWIFVALTVLALGALGLRLFGGG